MLSKYYKLHGVNDTGQTMTYADAARIAIRLMPWVITSGALSFRTTITDDLGFGSGTIADAGLVSGSSHDNSSNLDFGIKGFIEVTHDLAAADGVFRLYLEESDDDTNWPSAGDSFDVSKHCRQIAVLGIVNDAVDESSGVNFEF